VAAAPQLRSGCRFHLRQKRARATALLASVGAPVKETQLPKIPLQNLKAQTTLLKKSGGGLDKNSRRLPGREKAIRRRISSAIAMLVLAREDLRLLILSRVKIHNSEAEPKNRPGLTIAARLPHE
jgi:hypothetical protein